jgi:hypothetical protein
LKLHRDRKGIWRIFPAPLTAEGAPAPTPVAAPLPGVEAPAADSVPVEVDVRWEEAAPAAEETASEAVPAEQAPSLVVEEAARAPLAAERRARKPRAAKASGKSGPRKTAARRKPKGPAPQ